MSQTEVVQYMSQATSEDDWNRRCDDVKRRCGGYPAFWYSAIIMSGLLGRLVSIWKQGSPHGSAGISISDL